MLILPLLPGAFRPPKPENRILLRYALDGHGYEAQIQVAGDANVSVPVWLPKVDGTAAIAGCQQFLFSAPGKDSGESARCGLRWLKSSEPHR